MMQQEAWVWTCANAAKKIVGTTTNKWGSNKIKQIYKSTVNGSRKLWLDWKERDETIKEKKSEVVDGQI